MSVNPAGRPHVRASRPVVVVTVLLTSGFWLLGMVAYTKVTDRAAKVGRGPSTDGQTQEAAEPTTRPDRTEALALALATMASTKPEQRPSAMKEAEPIKEEAPSPPPAEATPPSKEEAAAQRKADAFTLDQQLQTEEVDPVWSPKLERQTAESIAQIGNGLYLDQVTCRETLCRAKVSHQDAKTREDDVEKLLNLPVVAGQAMVVTPSNDDRSTVVYFSRKGTYLSVLEQPTQTSLPPSIPPEVMPPSVP
jgi:hypothetical protein